MEPTIFDDEEDTLEQGEGQTLPTLPADVWEDEEEEVVEFPSEEGLVTIPSDAWEVEASKEEAQTLEIPKEDTSLPVIPQEEFISEGQEPAPQGVEEDKSLISSLWEVSKPGFQEGLNAVGQVLPWFSHFTKLPEEYERGQDQQASVELGITQERGQTFTKQDIISDPDKMQIVRDYMTLRAGVQYTDKSDEETYEDYLTSMRYVQTNDLSVLQDMRLMDQISEEDKPKIGKAYLLFQASEGAEGVVSNLSALKDYGVGIITSPSTWAGIGAGKVLGSVGTRSAARVMITAAKESAIKSAIQSGAKSSVAKAAGAAAARQAAATAARSVAARTAAATLAADTVLSVGSDALYQSQMIESNAQDEYSFAQGAFAAASAIVPAGIAGGLQYKTWKGGAAALGATIEAGNSATKAARRANAISPKAVNQAFKVFSDELIDWQKAVARGDRINLDSRAAQTRVYEALVGSPQGSLGLLPTLMKNAGVVLSKEAPAIQEMISFYRGIDTKTRWQINQQMKAQLGMSMGRLTDILAKNVNTSASQVGYLGQVAKEIQQVATAQTAANNLVAKVGGEGIGDVTLRGIQYFQSVWRRSLVSHPATSAVNVMGWGQVRSAEALSFLLSGVSHGTLGLAAMVAKPFSAKAKTFSNLELKKAVSTFQAVGYQLQNLLDPYATREAFDQILPYLNKETRETLTSSSFAGVETTAVGVARKGRKGKPAPKPDTIYGFDPKGPVVSRVEKYLDGIATATLVKTQDSYTKSISFLGNLDYQLRMSGGKGLMQTLKEGGIETIPQEVMDKATKRTMRDVMSLDYTKGSNAFHKIADFVEGLSNTPGLGMVFPFGRFLNNSLAFSFRYSLVGLGRIFSVDTIDDIPTIFAQAAVGTTFAYQMVKHEGEKYEQGIPWYVEEGEDGTQYDFTNLSPSSAYSLMGRIWYHFTQDETDMDLDTVKDLFTQLGSLSLVYTADRNTELLTKSFQDFTNRLAQASESGEDISIFREALTGIMLAGDSVLAGLTRPLEVPNVLVGTGLHQDQITDRSMLEGTDLFASEATRYVDQLFSLFNGGELGPRKVSATNPKAGREYSPWSRLVGLKIRQPQTEVERMLAEADFPEWRANSKTAIPELDRVINERVFNYLEKEAKYFLSTPRWKNSSLEERRDYVRKLIKGSQEDVRAWIDESPGSFEHLVKARRELTTQPERFRREAKKTLGISDVPDRQLTYLQMEQMRVLIDLYKEDEKAYLE